MLKKSIKREMLSSLCNIIANINKACNYCPDFQNERQIPTQGISLAIDRKLDRINYGSYAFKH